MEQPALLVFNIYAIWIFPHYREHPLTALKDFFDDYKCDCVPGYMGRDCEQEIDECSPNPCINGNCTNLLNNYTCQCFDNFTVSDI